MHHADAVGERKRLFLVVRDEDRRDVQLALDLADRAAQFFADLGIERAERLVHQQHFGPMRERARDRDALLLAAGELRGQPVVHAFERDELQQFLARERDARRALTLRTRNANSMFSPMVMWRNNA